METVYVETTVIGHLVGRIQKSPVVAARQEFIRRWWATAHQEYRLMISPLVRDECGDGDPDAARERLEVISSLTVLEGTLPVLDLTKQLLQAGAIPPSEPRDAFHIAISAVHGVDYLMTWNFRHIANATMRRRIEAVCRDAGVEPPMICTPEELAGEYSNDLISD